MGRAKRAKWRRGWRRLLKAERPAHYAIKRAQIVDLERLMRLVEIEPCGCWRWLGEWHRDKPRVRYQGAEMHARRAILEAHGRPHAAKRLYWARCGRRDCMAPDHVVVETRTERARREALDEFRRRAHGAGAGAGARADAVDVDDGRGDPGHAA